MSEARQNTEPMTTAELEEIRGRERAAEEPRMVRVKCPECDGAGSLEALRPDSKPKYSEVDLEEFTKNSAYWIERSNHEQIGIREPDGRVVVVMMGPMRRYA